MGPLETYFSEILIGIRICLFKKMQLEMSLSAIGNVGFHVLIAE